MSNPDSARVILNYIYMGLLKLYFQSVEFLLQNRPSVEIDFRPTQLKERIDKNAKRHLVDKIVMDLLSVILEPSNGDFHNDLFSNWVPQNDFARHLVISSNEPDKTIRETSLKVCSPFSTSLTPTLHIFSLFSTFLIAFFKTDFFKNKNLAFNKSLPLKIFFQIL